MSAIPLSAARPSPLTQRMLVGPILPTLLWMAWPNVLVMVLQSAVGLIETYFVGQLGTSALAGVSLVFPVTMLMTMMSAGALGGGISSSIARALGAGDAVSAERFAGHAIIVSLLVGCAFGLLFLGFGRPLYRLMGGTDAALDAAITYSHWVFLGMPLVWLFNGLASTLRGTGNMIVPSLVICLGTAVLLPLSALLIFGWGPMPGFGVAGGGMAVVIYYALGCAALFAYFAARRPVVRPRFSSLQWRYMRDMLRVGGIGALNTLQTNGTTAVLTALFAAFGAAGIAGYGVSSRIEYVLIPFGFGFGAPLVAIVGTNLGAGNVERAYRAAWIGAGVAFVVAETVGLLAATFPARWIGLFDTDPQVIAAGSVYLRHVGPFYGLFGAAIVLNLASQGAQRVMWPFLAGTARLLVAAGGGSIAVAWFGASLEAVSLLVAIGVILFGGINIAAVWARTWTKAAAQRL